MSEPGSMVGRPSTIVLAAVLVGVEGLSAFVFGAAAIGQIRVFRAVVGAGVALLMIGFAVVLLAAARGLVRGRRWSRGPAVATQLILVPVGWSFRGDPTTAVSVVMIGVAAVTLVALLHPRSTGFLIPPDPHP